LSDIGAGYHSVKRASSQDTRWTVQAERKVVRATTRPRASLAKAENR